jgi:hypothetical protein
MILKMIRDSREWPKPLWPGRSPESIQSGSLEPMRQAARVNPKVIISITNHNNITIAATNASDDFGKVISRVKEHVAFVGLPVLAVRAGTSLRKLSGLSCMACLPFSSFNLSDRHALRLQDLISLINVTRYHFVAHRTPERHLDGFT